MLDRPATRDLEGIETAARHIVPRVPRVHPADSSARILHSLRGRRYDHVAEFPVLEDGRLRGLIRLKDVIAAGPEETAENLMDSDPPTVTPGVDQEAAAWKAVRHGESCIAVVDEDGRFVGLVPPHRLLEVMLQEHVEDLARLGGYLKGQASAREVSGQSMRQRLAHRLPWLIAGLAGSIAAAALVGVFGGQISNTVVLAFFIPGIVYLADAVGTQTETVIVRDLSLGVPIREVAVNELVTGAAVGILLGVAAFPIVLAGWGRSDVAATFGVSLAAACFIATGVSMSLPSLLNRMGFDPALGAGPLATVITDLCSIAVYFALAAVFVA